MDCHTCTPGKSLLGKSIRSSPYANPTAWKDAVKRCKRATDRKAGISESEGMKISGDRTNSVYKRYDSIDEGDQRRAVERGQK